MPGTDYISYEDNIIEVTRFYYESPHEFFNNAIEIKHNNDILYSGYSEPGVKEDTYIKGKYKTCEETVQEIKKMIGNRDYKVSKNNPLKKNDYEKW